MPIFKIEKSKAVQVSVKGNGFGSEFELRDFFAENLEEILGVRFLEKEYQTTDGRIDTLGIDENDSPVIIEYKWKENEEVLAQGLFYFDWLMKNKKHFELLVKNHFGQNAEINWEQPRIILIARGFSRYIKAAVQRVGNVELKTYTLYDSDILHIENEYSPIPEKAHTAKKEDKQSEKTEYNLDYHLNITSPAMKKSFNELRDMILQLPSVEEKIGQKTGITYRTNKSFVRFEFRKDFIVVLLRDSKYPGDLKSQVKDITEHEWGYKGLFKFTAVADLNYLFSLVKASYDSTL